MASPQTTVARSLKRLGFRLTRIGRSFTIVGGAGALAIGSKTGMTLAEIEQLDRRAHQAEEEKVFV